MSLTTNTNNEYPKGIRQVIYNSLPSVLRNGMNRHTYPVNGFTIKVFPFIKQPLQSTCHEFQFPFRLHLRHYHTSIFQRGSITVEWWDLLLHRLFIEIIISVYHPFLTESLLI